LKHLAGMASSLSNRCANGKAQGEMMTLGSFLNNDIKWMP